MTSFENAKPTVLIGQDNQPLLVKINVVHAPWRGLAASKIFLGWVVHGTMFENNRKGFTAAYFPS